MSVVRIRIAEAVIEWLKKRGYLDEPSNSVTLVDAIELSFRTT